MHYTFYFQLNILDEVVSVCTATLDNQPPNTLKVQILVIRGRAFSHQGQYENAIDDLRTAFIIDHDKSV